MDRVRHYPDGQLLGNSRVRTDPPRAVYLHAYSMIVFLLNAALSLAGLGLALLFSARHAHWGPEGPVGGGLLLVPYVGLAAAVLTTLIVRGAFAWLPGGRATALALWIGLVIAFAVSGFYAMSDPRAMFEQVAALSGWLLLAGCFVAVNATSSIAARAVIIATLGVGGAAGWLQAGAWLTDYFEAKEQAAVSGIAHDREFQEQLEAELRALGKEAPLWKYFGYMYNSNQEIRKECLDIIAARADRDARLIEYLDSEILASDATRYIGEFHPAPGPAPASAFGRRSELLLSQISDLDAGSNQLDERSYADVRDVLRAAIRIQNGGGDLTSQLEAWRRYLKRFRNTVDLAAPIEQTLARPNAR